MRRAGWLTRLAALKLALLVVLAGFYFLVRPWYLGWGATTAERARALPGDQIVPVERAAETTTRAITINAAPDQVWPWIAQLGQDRGGFYSFEILEDLVGARIDNSDRLLPNHQDWKPGDKLWMYPPGRLGGQGHAAFVTIDPGHALGFATRQVGTPVSEPYNGSWAFIVEPIDSGTSRLLVRGRVGGPRGLLGAAFDHFIFEPAHFVMERRMMLGIKQRAEHQPVYEFGDVALVIFWSINFAMFITAAVWVMRRTKWVGALAAFVCAAVAFQILTFTQPAAILGGFLLFELVVVFWLAVTPRPLPAE